MSVWQINFGFKIFSTEVQIWNGHRGGLLMAGTHRLGTSPFSMAHRTFSLVGSAIPGLLDNRVFNFPDFHIKTTLPWGSLDS